MQFFRTPRSTRIARVNTPNISPSMKFSTSNIPIERSALVHPDGSIDMASTIVSSSHQNPEFDMLVLHGLFGQGSNWTTVSKRLVKNIPCRIHMLDIRNHGRSPHTKEMDYNLLVKDLHR
jgi:pimeloyl-ACP methyl ester carboxylesterase